MKITQRQLRQIIREEVSRLLNEQDDKVARVRVRGHDDLQPVRAGDKVGYSGSTYTVTSAGTNSEGSFVKGRIGREGPIESLLTTRDDPDRVFFSYVERPCEDDVAAARAFYAARRREDR
jgi:hypothetical protein